MKRSQSQRATSKTVKALIKSGNKAAERELRLDCLNIASTESGPDAVLKAAERYFNWVTGKAEKLKPTLSVVSPLKPEGINDNYQDD